ncbi:MAG: peptide deformylase [Vicingaceae bacterium]|nr:MAG: peptide deformylase [Vicingaceae bacterium]
MIYPIVAYGDPVLRKKAKEIDLSSVNVEELTKLIDDMFETMYKASGVGLAAPQIGKSIRLFIVDASPFADDDPQLQNFKKVFINPEITEKYGGEWKFNEGCLSIPGIREDVNRPTHIKIRYFDESLNQKEEVFDGLASRIIQHEYDHIEGILFIDHLNPLRKKLLQSKLKNISKGNVKVDYKMKFPAVK